MIEYFAYKNLQVNTKTKPYTLVKIKSPKKNSPVQAAATDSSLEMMSSPVSPQKSSPINQEILKKRSRKPKTNYHNPEEPALVPTVSPARLDQINKRDQKASTKLSPLIIINPPTQSETKVWKEQETKIQRIQHQEISSSKRPRIEIPPQKNKP